MKNYLEILEPIADEMSLNIVSMKSVGNDLYEVIIANKDNLEPIDLETSSKAANAFAEAIDYEVSLDVSSEGAEKVISLDLIDTVIGAYVHVKFINPSQGFDHVEGELIDVTEDILKVQYRFKHTHRILEVERNNIDLMRLAVKI